MNSLSSSCSKLGDVVRTHPTETVGAAVGAGIVLGALVHLLHHYAPEPTRMDTAMGVMRGFGNRMRSLFR